jgi:hypothetical protein
MATEANRVFEPAVRRVLAKAGFSPKVEYVTLARMQDSLNRHVVDGAFVIGDASLSMTDGIKVPVPLLQNEIVAVSVDPDVVVRQVADLARYRVDVLRGNKDQAELTAGCPRVEENTGYERLLQKSVGFAFRHFAMNCIIYYPVIGYMVLCNSCTFGGLLQKRTFARGS